MDVRLLMMISTVAACLVGVSGRPKRNRRTLLKTMGMTYYRRGYFDGMTDCRNGYYDDMTNGNGMPDYRRGYFDAWMKSMESYGATFVATLLKPRDEYDATFVATWMKAVDTYGATFVATWWRRRASNNNTAVALTCNQCSVGLFGTCLIPDSVECDASEPNCYTGKAEFPSISGFLGFNTQGCLDSASCNSTTDGTILGATYKVTRTCCATEKCNPVVSGAGSVQLSLTAAASAALVVCLWSCLPY